MSSKDNDHIGDLLIQEVDEDLRRDQYMKLWRRYGGYAVAVVLGVVVLVAGYQGWRSWNENQRQQESRRFAAAASLVADGKTAEALDALAKLSADGRTGYAAAALMATADIKARSGDITGAIAAYDRLAASGAPSLYRDLATLKGALLAIDAGDGAGVEGKLNGLISAGNPWRHSALEGLAMAAAKKGDATRAADLYKQLADDPQAPQGVRARAAEMLAALPLSPTASPVDKPKG